MDDSLHLKVSGSVATVTLRRAAVHNALDEALTANLAQAFQKLGVADMVRVIVLAAEGESFCAGADLGWLTRVSAMDPAAAQRETMSLAVALDAVARCPKPVVAVVQGAALGIGAGLVAAADMAVASDGASFALPEIRLGMAAAVPAPYLTDAMGMRACRRYMLTGERFDAREAMRLGLVHGVAAADKLAVARDHLVEACLKGAPKAQADSKDILRLAVDTPLGPDMMRLTAGRLAQSLLSDEGRWGLEAYADNRKPEW